MSVNPYDPPMGESLDPKPVANLADIDRDGAHVVVLVTGERAILPPVCVLTGATADLRPMVGYVDASARAVMAMQTRFSWRFVPVDYMLSAEHAAAQAGRESRAKFLCLMAGLAVVLVLAGIVIQAIALRNALLSTTAISIRDSVLTAVGLGTAGLFVLSGFHVASVLHGPFRVTRVLGGRIWLAGPSQEFLEAIDAAKK